MYKQESNPLHSWFFSSRNVDQIQNSIRREVANQTGVSIGRQNDNDLLAIMNSVYSVNSWNPYGDYENQLKFMNSKVGEKAVSQIRSGILSYKMYLNDISRQPVPSDLPVNTSIYGKKLSIDNRFAQKN